MQQHVYKYSHVSTVTFLLLCYQVGKFPNLVLFSMNWLQKTSIILWEYCKNNAKKLWCYSYENKQIRYTKNCSPEDCTHPNPNPNPGGHLLRAIFGEQFSGHEQIIISRNLKSLIFLSYSKRSHHQDYIYFYKNVPENKSILQLRIRLKGTLMQIWKSPHILKFI